MNDGDLLSKTCIFIFRPINGNFGPYGQPTHIWSILLSFKAPHLHQYSLPTFVKALYQNTLKIGHSHSFSIYHFPLSPISLSSINPLLQQSFLPHFLLIIFGLCFIFSQYLHRFFIFCFLSDFQKYISLIIALEACN